MPGFDSDRNGDKVMMNNLENIAKTIKETNRFLKVTPRMFINAVGYERRSPNACKLIDDFLEENDLEVVPHYLNEWVERNGRASAVKCLYKVGRMKDSKE